MLCTSAAHACARAIRELHESLVLRMEEELGSFTAPPCILPLALCFPCRSPSPALPRRLGTLTAPLPCLLPPPKHQQPQSLGQGRPGSAHPSCNGADTVPEGSTGAHPEPVPPAPRTGPSRAPSRPSSPCSPACRRPRCVRFALLFKHANADCFPPVALRCG